ncbi:hypothetical protein ACWEPM_16725 [Streptomyces sp. NPDC004244]|uniref:hypothetical protein n=1 Tax=Streptomyces sp. NPDC101206 TaxID=3366128 RepID=UPI0038210343
MTELDALLRRMPAARGRADLETLQQLMRRIAGAGRQNQATARRTGFARLVAAARGRTAREQTSVQQDVLAGQAGLVRHLERLSAHAVGVDADVARIAGHLRRTDTILNAVERRGIETARLTADLAEGLAGLAEFVASLETRAEQEWGALRGALGTLERRVGVLEAADAADTHLGTVLHAWRSGATYTGLPWTCQVPLLAEEVFRGPCGLYESLGGDERRYRDRLAHALTAEAGPALWSERRPVAAVLDALADDLGDGEPRLLVAEILGAGLPPGLDGPRGPLTAALRARLAPRDPAPHAPRTWLPARLDGPAYVRHTVDEQADHALRARRDAHPFPGEG